MGGSGGLGRLPRPPLSAGRNFSTSPLARTGTAAFAANVVGLTFATGRGGTTALTPRELCCARPPTSRGDARNRRLPGGSPRVGFGRGGLTVSTPPPPPPLSPLLGRGPLGPAAYVRGLNAGIPDSCVGAMNSRRLHLYITLCRGAFRLPQP